MYSDSNQLEAIFNQCFQQNYHVCLKGGFDEPIYLPQTKSSLAIIGYRDDYFASALHEISHWCLAGKQRLLQQDYGYWYINNRSIEQQCKFLEVEVKPQALEAYFSAIVDYPFQVSLDHFATPTHIKQQFEDAVEEQFQRFKTDALLNDKAKRFASQLSQCH